MSKQEMVTIEVPVGSDKFAVYAAYRKALDARKTKYERWREYMGFPWEHHAFSPRENVLNGRVFFRGDENPQTNTRDCHPTLDQSKLMAAAPQLLEALIGLCKRGYTGPTSREGKYAIRAALPEDVAAEVLDEWKS